MNSRQRTSLMFLAGAIFIVALIILISSHTVIFEDGSYIAWIFKGCIHTMPCAR